MADSMFVIIIYVATLFFVFLMYSAWQIFCLIEALIFGYFEPLKNKTDEENDFVSCDPDPIGYTSMGEVE